jgi:hypothetical protein
LTFVLVEALLKLGILCGGAFMNNSDESVLDQYVAIIVLRNSNIRPVEVLPILQSGKAKIGDTINNAIIHAIGKDRNTMCSVEKLEYYRKELIKSTEKGTVWLAVVNGMRNAKIDFSPLEPVVGINPELNLLYSNYLPSLLERKK